MPGSHALKQLSSRVFDAGISYCFIAVGMAGISAGTCVITFACFPDANNSFNSLTALVF